MLTMDQIKDIKYLYERKGLSLRNISKESGHAFETVKKYAQINDFNIKLNVKKERNSKLTPFKPLINEWLDNDVIMPRKQRHTAQRIYERLKEIYGDKFNVSDRTVRTYVAKVKKELYGNNNAYLPLSHPPGEAQVDFGEAEFVENGNRFKGHYLNISFPYSNAGYLQLFKSENQECLLQGLQNIFEYIGGVPHCIWFDNMSTAVKRIKKEGQRDKTQFFERFELHYGFSSNFCNPASGHEKGSVENKVGYHRRNFLVPIPEFKKLEEYNKGLLKKCDQDMNRKHYKKRKLISKLFAEDKHKMIKLPEVKFDVFKLVAVKANNYGMVNYDSNSYSSSPRYAGNNLWLKAEAHRITILNQDYQEIQQHRRLYGEKRESMKWIPYLELMAKRPTALKYTDFFHQLPQTLREYLDNCNYQGKKATLNALRRMICDSDIKTAEKAFKETLSLGLKDLDSIYSTYYRMTKQIINPGDLKLKAKVPEVNRYTADLELYDELILVCGQR